MTASDDPRLRLAVDASRAWYDDVFTLHGRATRSSRDLWWSTAEPVPWHSCAKTLRPGVPVESALAAVAGRPECSVADSFADLGLDAHGFHPLFTATWLHHAPLQPDIAAPAGWSLVTSAQGLAAWTKAHDYEGVLPAEVLGRRAFRILGHHRDGVLVGGAVAHDAGSATGLSNVWTSDRSPIDWTAVLAAATHQLPGRPVVAYERGPALVAALAAGFAAVGEHRVWLR